jgi:arsenate reductase (glutaredoxin)
MIIYVYAKCSTCKQALLFLKKHRIAFTAKEITIEPPSIIDLKQMLKYQNGNLKKIFNTSGLLYKQMLLSEKLEEMPLGEALVLLNQHGMLVKRPFLLGNNFGLTGFSATIWSQKFDDQFQPTDAVI